MALGVDNGISLRTLTDHPSGGAGFKPAPPRGILVKELGLGVTDSHRL